MGLIGFAVTAIAFAAVSCAKNDPEPTQAAAPEIGSPAPSIGGTLITGDNMSLSSLKGKPVIVTFWATTCAPCQRELPALQAIADEHTDDGLTVLAVNEMDSLEAVQDYVSRLGLTFPIMMDTEGIVAAHYEIVVLPMTYFISRNGIIMQRSVGEPRPNVLPEAVEQIVASTY